MGEVSGSLLVSEAATHGWQGRQGLCEAVVLILYTRLCLWTLPGLVRLSGGSKAVAEPSGGSQVMYGLSKTIITNISQYTNMVEMV